MDWQSEEEDVTCATHRERAAEWKEAEQRALTTRGNRPTVRTQQYRRLHGALVLIDVSESKLVT